MPTGSIRQPFLLAAVVLSWSLTSCTSSASNFRASVDSPAASAPPKLATVTSGPTMSGPIAADRVMPHYEHIFVIVAENKGYDQIIGSPNAPRLNQLAQTYGLATRFYGEVHPSEANYIAMLGGSTFGIHDDDAYYCQPGQVDLFCGHSRSAGYVSHTIASRSLMDQLQERGLTWKGYFEDLPAAGSTVVVAPGPTRPLYAAKHNGFLNFKSVQTDPHLSDRIVPLEQLAADLNSGHVPNYSHIILNQCHEMHGLAECAEETSLIQTSDAQIGEWVDRIMQSKLWTGAGHQAIVITWDEDDGRSTGTQGCCSHDPSSPANFGGGRIPTIVITNHGPRHLEDSTPYNHYSLLRTTEAAFGLSEYLNHAGDTDRGVQSMVPLFAVSAPPG